MTPFVLFLVRRLLFALLLVLVVSTGSMWLAHLAPRDYTTQLRGPGVSADTLARERERLGLDRPLSEQYGDWLVGLTRFDLGTSFRYSRPVTELVGERAANTAVLAGVALLIATGVGLPLGVIAGSSASGVVVSMIRGVSVFGMSLPPLVTSLLFALFAARTGWFPIGGMTSLRAVDPSLPARLVDIGWHLVLPALALALPVAATLERLLARSLRETLTEPFIMAALARGIPRRRVVWRHALRVAVRPVAGIYGVIVGSLLSGSFAVEIVTSWPGLGRLMFEALRSRDVQLVAGCAAIGSVFLAFGNLLSDLGLVAADPRLREE
ncbi:MAG TPA: ABC transporter permease [Acidobacteria bacterium]|nr:ABC transporter permease [Acidobacteriota bacterium]